MDNWKRFEETLLLVKENFYSHLSMEDITDADYQRAKKYGKNLK